MSQVSVLGLEYKGNRITFSPVKQNNNGVWYYREQNAQKPVNQLAQLSVQIMPDRTADAARVEVKFVFPSLVEKDEKTYVKLNRASFRFDADRALSGSDVSEFISTALSIFDQTNHIGESVRNLEALY